MRFDGNPRKMLFLTAKFSKLNPREMLFTNIWSLVINSFKAGSFVWHDGSLKKFQALNRKTC